MVVVVVAKTAKMRKLWYFRHPLDTSHALPVHPSVHWHLLPNIVALPKQEPVSVILLKNIHNSHEKIVDGVRESKVQNADGPH